MRACQFPFRKHSEKLLFLGAYSGLTPYCLALLGVQGNKTGHQSFSMDNSLRHLNALSSWFRECLHNWCWPWSSKPSGVTNELQKGFLSHLEPTLNFPSFLSKFLTALFLTLDHSAKK